MTEQSNSEIPNARVTGRLEDAKLRVKIIGVGGAGNNAVDRLKLDNLDQVDLAVINTDSKTLSASPISNALMIGRTVTRGLSTGGEPDLGRKAAEADREAIRRMVDGTDLVFLLAGLGGGTGSGAAPVIAEIAAEVSALTIAFVTMPFSREGHRRHKQAEDALALLRQTCHAVVTLPNDLLLQQIDEEATLLDAFTIADEWMYRGVSAIVSMLQSHGLINVDFATLREAFSNRGGKTLFGLASAEGPDTVKNVLRDLDICPLLHLPENKYIRKTDSLIVNITGGPDLSMAMVHEILEAVTERFSSRENTVIGAVIDGGLRNRINLCIIGATDLGPTLRRNTVQTRPAITPRPERPLPQARDVSVVMSADPDTAAEETNLGFTPPPEQSVSGSAPSPSVSAADTGTSTAIQGQSEFDFASADASRRGIFIETEQNLYEGSDLDVPTYLRRGIRIQL